MAKIAVNIVTGFLGSGKTTFLSELLRDSRENIAVLVNEFGDSGLDDSILASFFVEEQTILLNQGCICCNRRQDLADKLKEILNLYHTSGKKLDKVVIETTGLATIEPILFTILSDTFLQNHFFVNAVFTCIDSLNGLEHLKNEENIAQIVNSDYLLITKTDIKQDTKMLEKELREDQKENAEHLMLIDLARSDIGKVAKTGSIKPLKLHEIERYSRVMHIVSEIKGKLKKSSNIKKDAIYATFPAGTVSGAPKIEAIKTILELEPHSRGIYSGLIGYFDEDKKKPIPEEITKLGVVTSPTGAAIRDILNITRRRAPSLDIIIFPCAVQGDGAAESIAMRIRQANSFLACDVLIVGRGGGSAEDLSCFSEPCVIEAIHDSEIPVISAVGHEIDWPISDFVADRRAPTPSAAAELVTETIFRRRERLDNALFSSTAAMKEKMLRLSSRLRETMHNADVLEKKIIRYRGSIPSTEDLRKMLILRMENARTSLAYDEEEIIRSMERKTEERSKRLLDSLKENNVLFKQKMEKAEREITTLQKEMDAAVGSRMRAESLKLASIVKETEALSPLLILRRGYTVTEREDGSIVRKASDVHSGEKIKTRTGDGIITSTVIGG